MTDLSTKLLRNKTVLITGGAGAIGSNLVRELLKIGCTVIALDDLSSGYESLLPKHKNLVFIKGSILDDAILKKAFSYKPNIIYHIAAFFANQNSVDHPEQDLMVNIMGTLKVLEYAKPLDIERFIYTSSSCVYGNNFGMNEDERKFNFDTPYAISKYSGEQYVKFFHEMYKMKTVTVRLFNSFGPGEKPGKYRNVVPNFFDKAIRGESLTVYGTGDETRDFNWIGNAMQMLLKCATQENAIGQTFNVGSGKETKIIDLVKLINKISGNKAQITFLPARSWDKIKRRRANIEKSKKLLGYDPDTKEMEQKLRMTYDWINGLSKTK